MATTDRRDGLSQGVAIKLTCAAATTGANITLESTQVVDGIAVGTSERVLVKDQTDASENGIYISDSSTWTRAKDCDGINDLLPGTVVFIDRGDTNAQGLFTFNSSSTATSIDIGTDDITVSQITQSLAGVTSFSSSALTLSSASAWRTQLELGSGSTQAIATDSTNTWTAANEFSDLYAYSTANSTAETPAINTIRQSTAAANTPIGAFRTQGFNSSGETKTAAKWTGEFTDITADSEDGVFKIHTNSSGTVTHVWSHGLGSFSAGATDPGLGSVNTTGDYYRRGVSLEWQTTDVIDLTSSSPTSVTLLTGLSTDVHEIHIHLSGLSMDSATAPLLRIGPSGGAQTSGYGGWVTYEVGGSHAAEAHSTGFLLHTQSNMSAATNMYGDVHLTHMGSNVWTLDISVDTSLVGVSGGGSVTLTGAENLVQIETVGSTAIFDAGSAYMRYR